MAKSVTAKTIALTFQSGKYRSHIAFGIAPFPPAPTLTILDVGSTQATVTLSAADATVTKRTPYLNGAALSTISPSLTQYVYTGLAAATPYSLYFTDTNVSGESAPSGAVPILTDNPPVVAPDPPVITFVSKDSTSITVTSVGSVGASSYIPNRAGVGDLPEITQFPYTFTGLLGSTAYTLTVKAKNSAGISAASNSVTQTTSAAITLFKAAPVSALLYGTTDWTNPPDEIARRAGNRIVCLTYHPGITAAQYSAHIAALRAINPSIIILAYLNFSEVQSTSSSGVWGPFWTMANDANWWARTAWPAGTITTIENSAFNIASPRKVGGVFSGEAFVDLYFSNGGDKLNQVDGYHLDNLNFRWPGDFDWQEINKTSAQDANNGRSSVAMRNAMIVGWQRIIARLRSHKPGCLIFGNPRMPGDYVKDGIDDRAAFRAMNIDGAQQQNCGPGIWFNFEGIFPYDGQPPNTAIIRTYPGGVMVPTGSTPIHGDLYRTTFGGVQHSAIPTTPNAPFIWDLGRDLHTQNYLANPQNMLMQCVGYSETEELIAGTNTTAAQKQQHNRACLGYWWVMTNITPYLLGIDTKPSGTGRCVMTSYQTFDWGNWIDPAGFDSQPYATVNGHTYWLRRAQNAWALHNPRFDDAGIPTQPISVQLPTPTAPAGKTTKLWDGSSPGSTVTALTRDTLFGKFV